MNGDSVCGGEHLDVAVVEDHPLYRAALVAALAATPGITVGPATASVTSFLAYRRPPGVVVLDLSLPGVSGPAAVLALVEAGHRVLVISAQAGAGEVVSAMAAGARGYLTKAADAEQVVHAVREIGRGGTYVSPQLASMLLDTARDRRVRPRLPLSDRERQVLALLAAGDRDVDIAQALCLSVRTVRSHLDRIREKTGRRRRPELTRLAIEEGILLGAGRA